MTESNLANGEASSVRHLSLSDVLQNDSDRTPENSLELISLRQEVALLKQKLAEQESNQKEVDGESSSHHKTTERLKRQVKNLKLELAHSESTAQTLARSLNAQLQHNWEQQQHELICSIVQLRSQTVSQQTQIQELNQHKQLLEATQKKLTENLETALAQLAQNAKSIPKTISPNLKEPANRTISLQSVLEQSIRSLQQEYTNSQNRIKELELQVGELQEQILMQSGQAVEFEAAVQHWKEKCLIYQNHALQLSSALERFIDGKDIPKLGDAPRVDLPAFLVRQRS